jgi:hypothetical protein
MKGILFKVQLVVSSTMELKSFELLISWLVYYSKRKMETVCPSEDTDAISQKTLHKDLYEILKSALAAFNSANSMQCSVVI